MAVFSTRRTSYFHRCLLLATFMGSTSAWVAPTMLWNPLKLIRGRGRDADETTRGKTSVISKAPTADSSYRVVQPNEILWAPRRESNDFDFYPMDVGEMGGISSSSFDNSKGLWKADVTEDSNGGLVGIRSLPNIKYDCTACRGLAVRVKLFQCGGDTSSRVTTFKFKMRNSLNYLDGLTFTTPVETPVGEEIVWYIPFSEQTPTQFTRVLPGEEFHKNVISGFKIVYSKVKYKTEIKGREFFDSFELGDMEIEIQELSTY